MSLSPQTIGSRPLLLIIVSAGLLAACHAQPRQRPVRMGPVDTGPESVEFVRRQLEGSWTLDSFETMDAKGVAQQVPARAKLVYDAFGNLTVEGTLLEAPAGAGAPPFLNYSGRIVIDPVKKEFRLLGLTGTPPTDRELAERLSTDLVRRYEVSASDLTISTVDAAGKMGARARFKRAGAKE